MNTRTAAIKTFVDTLFDDNKERLIAALMDMFKAAEPENAPLVPFMVDIAAGYRKRLVMVLCESSLEESAAVALTPAIGAVLSLLGAMSCPNFKAAYERSFKVPIQNDLLELIKGFNAANEASSE